MFDDTVAYFECMKAANPPLVNRWVDKISRINAGSTKEFTDKLYSLPREREQLPKVEYTKLPNIEKLKYVNLANSATPEELNFVKLLIAPQFEANIFMRMLTDKVLEEGFLDAHRY